MTRESGSWEGVHVVLADANVLYSRVLRDHLLYAAGAEMVAVFWSREILNEVAEHLVATIAGFTLEAGERLVSAMNAAFPYAAIEPGPSEYG